MNSYAEQKCRKHATECKNQNIHNLLNYKVFLKRQRSKSQFSNPYLRLGQKKWGFHSPGFTLFFLGLEVMLFRALCAALQYAVQRFSLLLLEDLGVLLLQYQGLDREGPCQLQPLL